MYSCSPISEGAVQVGGGATSGADTAARASVAAGFGSPAQDSGVTRLDLNDILIRHPQATFLMRISGDAMREAGIASGDIVLVDRSITPAHGQVVIAVLDGEFVCRRLVRHGETVRFQATDPNCADIVLGEGQEAQVWGVVSHAIKPMPL